MLYRPDLDVHLNNSFEFITVEVVFQTEKKIVVRLLYRPPSGDLDTFNEKFESFLDAISNKNDYCILAGDYNINLLNHETHGETGQFLNNIYDWSYLPVIIRHARFTETSATLIENIFTNIPNESALTGILIADISDHLPIFLYF